MLRRALGVLVLAALGAGCGDGCACSEGGARMSCAGAALSRPPALHRRLLVLDLSGNNISSLQPDAFAAAPALRDLELSGNALTSVPPGALRLAALARLSLAGCGLRAPPPLAGLPALTHLSLERNELSEMSADALAALPALRDLRLDHNRLRLVPTAALRPLQRLQLLSVANNLLEELLPDSLPTLPDLHTLVLRHNRLLVLHARSLAPLPALRVLHVEHNRLQCLSAALESTRLEELWAGHNAVARVRCDAGPAPPAPRLRRLDLRHNPLRAEPHALVDAPGLLTLVVSECRSLSELPALGGARLHTIRADRCGLRRLPAALCRLAPRLRTLDVRDNRLSELPDLADCGELRVLDASSNHLEEGVGTVLRGLTRLHDLQLAHNRLRTLDADAFRHTPALRTLDLEDNLLDYIDSEAFLPITKLEDLNVGNNVFPQLPAAGLRHLLHLKTHNNPNLRRFHPPEAFPHIQTLVLSYAYHCCEFLPAEEEEVGARTLTDFVLVPARDTDAHAWANASDLWPLVANATGGARLRELLAAWGSASPLVPGSRRAVRCVPAPGPFLPCVDLFDWWTLRCGVWAVFLLALLGNGTVLFVLVFSRGRTDVPRFLVANLAAADLCMAVYLGLLAVVDAATLGEFRAHAVAWQLSAACRLAGFLGVLSTELSVYTLAVITLERNYAITHAMHLNKRLSLRHAGAAMAAGWAGSLLAAALPLFGVSDYRKFAVCLPFETGSPASLAYVAALPVVNGVAFLVLLGCYLKMYCAIRGSQAWNSNDSRIARRMALLVFTDFLCWSPVALFSLTAAFGARLVSPEQAKVLTVFVLPLNSCCNPFLYAILTKQFKKDCALVCKAIEESRVTRGIGRCRHSSNFSNRQTPAATGSLSGSRGPAPCPCRRLLPAPPAPAPRRLLRWLWPAPAASASTSADFSSSRSDSWRRAAAPAAGRPGRGAWPAVRKTSQDSNLSSSRNDSSGSGSTATTAGTWRPPPHARPRLTRQPALLLPDDRLHTIPSAAEEPA